MTRIVIDETPTRIIVAEDDTVRLVTQDVTRIIEIAQTGPQGAKGDPGDPGPSNLFIQQTDPSPQPDPFLWIELHGDNTLKTFWIGTP